MGITCWPSRSWEGVAGRGPHQYCRRDGLLGRLFTQGTPLASLPGVSRFAKAGARVPSCPETAAQFHSTAKSSLAMAGVGVSKSTDSYLDQQRVNLPRPKTLKLRVKFWLLKFFVFFF